MSQRCKICDFSPHTPSIYHEGLVTRSPHRNHLLREIRTDDYICAECVNASREFHPDDDELFITLLESIDNDDIEVFPRFTEE